jgi:hypothetical protein
MPRQIDPLVLAQYQLQSNVLRFAMLVDLTFASETLHIWTGTGTYSWSGNSYLGVGHLGSISQIQEDSTVQAQSVTLTLESVTEDNLTEALGDIQQGAPVKIWAALFQADGKTLIGSPTLFFAGRVDQPTIKEGPEGCFVSIVCENRMADLQRPHERRYTQQEQQALHPGDTGFNYVQQCAWFVGEWGAQN